MPTSYTPAPRAAPATARATDRPPALDWQDLANLLNLIVLSNTRLVEMIDPDGWPAELAQAAIVAAERGLAITERLSATARQPGVDDDADVEQVSKTAPSVLVVDDDPRLLNLMSQAFARAGFQTFSAHNGKVAMQVLRATSPDLLITDIVMPEMEGLATIREAKALLPDLQVIAITGGGEYGSDRTYLSWAEHLGADEVLAKPFKCSALLITARRLLEQHRGSPSPLDA